jgi:signal peptidase I
MTVMTTEPPAAASPDPQPAPATKPASATNNGGGGGVKETIESILVAFILAFVFRAFIVEAFVIPTGSMATTLLGAHSRFHCPDCGYAFDMNYSDPRASEDEDLAVPANAGPITIPIYCPNCGFRVPNSQVSSPAVYYGDRILVLKYLYLLQEPKRWDVVVFKAPTNPNQNFIKRLIGRPGEAVMVLDGDIYIRPPNDPDPEHFVVQPKPPGVQSAMWRLVYDNDYHPTGAPRVAYPWHQPWQLVYGTGCQPDDATTGGRTFIFDTPHGGTKLEYKTSANPSGQTFSDYLVYDQNTRGRAPPSYGPPGSPVPLGPLMIPARSDTPGWTNPTDYPVSDLDLRLTYQRTAGAGPFTMALQKRGHTFTAELTPTTATLYHDVGTRHVQIGAAMSLPSGGGPVRVELSNADYQVTLRVDDAIVAQTTPSDYAPDLHALVREYEDQSTPPSPTVSIRADDQQSRVSHVSLWRDVYYYNRNPVSNPTWARPDDFPRGAQPLGRDEFFTMGDNSEVSWDARCWPNGINLPAEDLDVGPGRVPGRFLLGKAFYVYWPAGYRDSKGWLPALIPDFTGMRLIH